MGKIKIIAEAGVNHNGNLTIAMKMIDEAAKSGADIIKFQTFKAVNLVSKFAPKAEYQKKLTSAKESQFDMIKKLELSFEDHVKLLNICRDKKIEFLSAPFDLESIDSLIKLGLETIKIPSGEITNFPYLKKLAGFNRNIILSSGMSSLGDIENALNILTICGTSFDNITVLHCNTEYPTPFIDVNLKAMLTIKNAFNVKVGYSDHTSGIEVSIAAAALGASVIEKHFTLDKNMEGPDHKASLEPLELKRMVESIRNIEKALGDGIKKPSESEIKNISIARKSIVASCNIKKGEILTEKNISVKRPGNGISPMRWEELIGTQAKRDFIEDELIEM